MYPRLALLCSPTLRVSPCLTQRHSGLFRRCIDSATSSWLPRRMNRRSLFSEPSMPGLLLPTLIISVRHDRYGHLDSPARIAWPVAGDRSIKSTGFPYSTRAYDQVLFEQWIGAVGYLNTHHSSSLRPPFEDAQGLRYTWQGGQHLLWHATTDLALPTHCFGASRSGTGQCTQPLARQRARTSLDTFPMGGQRPLVAIA